MAALERNYMAGDWIKMRTTLAADPAVIAMACALNLDEHTVVGKLHALWSWADGQCRTDGHAHGVTFVWVDRYVRADGFATSMKQVGWLSEADGGISFPRFDRHNTEPAKARALAAKRKRKERSKKSHEKRDISHANTVTREEKRRDKEKKQKKPAFAASDIAVPSELDTPEVRQALTEWLAHKDALGKQYKSPDSAAKLFKKFEGKPPVEFVHAVDFSIGNNYQGLFSPGPDFARAGPEEPHRCRVPSDEELENWKP